MPIIRETARPEAATMSSRLPSSAAIVISSLTHEFGDDYLADVIKWDAFVRSSAGARGCGGAGGNTRTQTDRRA